MERILNQDERIRRAEEIYARRQNLRIKTKSATVNVASEAPKKYMTLKKIGLQIIICILIYYIFYLVKTTNYSFSETALSRTSEIVSNDYDFATLYNYIVENINKLFNFSNNLQEDNQLHDNIENQENPENTDQIDNSNVSSIINTDIPEEYNIQDIAMVENSPNDESLTQNEITTSEQSETERIKSTYSFILPAHGVISSEYGGREVTASVVTAYHKGIDIAANKWDTIVASTEGEVIIAKNSPTYR